MAVGGAGPASALGLPPTFRAPSLSFQGRAELNGTSGTVLQWHEASERWAVESDVGGERLRVRSQNLVLHDPEGEPPGGGYAEEYVWVQTQE